MWLCMGNASDLWNCGKLQVDESLQDIFASRRRIFCGFGGDRIYGMTATARADIAADVEEVEELE